MKTIEIREENKINFNIIPMKVVHKLWANVSSPPPSKNTIVPARYQSFFFWTVKDIIVVVGEKD
jgi:hypothetical protein